MRDTKGHQVGGNGDAKYSGETRASRGGPTPTEVVSIQTRLIVRQQAYVAHDR